VKLVSAVIAPHRLAAVHDALRRFGLPGVTVSEVMERDWTRPDEVYRGRRVISDMDPHVRLDVLAEDSDADDLLRIIRRVAADGSGDGKVWVSPVEAAVRVRTGERGADAL
jgi:nitrogen regulatory protein P-II 1